MSARYVSREMDGYEDLDQYGSWASQPGYGQVWMPTSVAAGWTPYHDGHWAWIAPWGWTVGGRRTVGIRSLPLRPMGFLRWPMGLDTWTVWSNTPLCTGAGRVDRGRPRRLWLQPDLLLWQRCGGRVVPLGTTRALLPSL
jgi:hypothetical protein